MKVLITGGAGYLGSTIASAFLDAGDRVVLLDDLSGGRRANMLGRPAYIGDVADRALLERVFVDHPDIALVVHCAARVSVPESLVDPLGYYRTNTAKTIDLLDALTLRGCRRLIFSSSAAVYGPATGSVDETRSPTPQTPYAAGKLMIERVLDDAVKGGALDAVSFRFFNPIGCDPALRTGPAPSAEQPVLDAILTAAARSRSFWINGTDWPTPDGTPMRDFVDVWDVARAHVRAAHSWARLGRGRHEVVNLGAGRSTSVGELVRVAQRILRVPVEVRHHGRRPGDTVGCHADVTKARTLFGWCPSREVTDSVTTAALWAGLAEPRPVRSMSLR